MHKTEVVVSHQLLGCYRVRIWTEEPFSVKVDEMIRVICDPDFRLPRDLWQEGAHRLSAFKGGDEDEPGFAALEEFL